MDADLEARLTTAARRAVRVFGAAEQWEMAKEESAEFITAHHHFVRGRITIQQLADEAADVRIMLAQVQHMLGERFDEALVRKLERLEKNLDVQGAA